MVVVVIRKSPTHPAVEIKNARSKGPAPPPRSSFRMAWSKGMGVLAPETSKLRGISEPIFSFGDSAFS